MTFPRVYHPHPLVPGQETVLESPASHHVARVLRLAVGDGLVLFPGTGGEYRARVLGLDARAVRVRVEAHLPLERESPLRVGLAQALSTGERMDLTVQKAVELGVAWIQPLCAHRSKVKLAGERAARRVEHWRRIVLAACEQCGRNRVPAVHEVLELDVWLPRLSDAQTRLLLEPQAAQRLSEVSAPAGELVLLAGAEAGFSPEEVTRAQASGFEPVRLGQRILRTETAGLAAVAAAQALWGDY